MPMLQKGLRSREAQQLRQDHPGTEWRILCSSPGSPTQAYAPRQLSFKPHFTEEETGSECVLPAQ